MGMIDALAGALFERKARVTIVPFGGAQRIEHRFLERARPNVGKITAGHQWRRQRGALAH